jgi:eukaryotic-like serine/threonine-protein kinase
VRHCLEKSPSQRFQSARDLAYNLESLSQISGPTLGSPTVPTTSPGRPKVVLPSALILAVALAAVAGYLLGRRGSRTPIPEPIRVHKLTLGRGLPLGSRFAPDGKTIVYSAGRGGENHDVFLTRTDGTESRALGVTNANVLAVSRNGEVAVALRSSPAPQFRVRSTLATVALLGGAPRPLLEDVLEADWSPDGRQLAVVRWANGREILEYPIGRPVETSDTALMRPRVSPDGRSIAFFRRRLVGKLASLILSKPGEQSRVLAPNIETKGTVAWHPSGREIWFDLDERGRTNICAVSLDGGIRTVYSGLDWIFLDDIAPDGAVLLSSWTARSAIYFRGPRDAQERDIAWLDWGFSQDLSRDGSLLLFDESGVGGGAHPAVYVRPTDGSPAIRLGEGKALRLSPDGKSALALVEGKLVVYPTGPGQPQTIPTGDVTPEYAAFFPDGSRIRLNGFQTGHDRRNWIVDRKTRQVRPLTPEGRQRHPVISPDGRSMALTLMKEKKIYVYPVEGGAPREIPGTTEEDDAIVWSEDGSSIYVWHEDEIGPKHIDKVDVSSGRRELWKTIVPADRNGVFDISGLAMTPDASAYVYTALRSLTGDLFVIEGLK